MNTPTLSTKKHGMVGNILTLIAFLGIILSFFVPLLVLDGKSGFNLIHLIENLAKTSKTGSYSLLSFMLQSFFAGLSILIGYMNGGKVLSLLGLFGIFFYGRALFSIFSHSESTANIFRVLRNLGISTKELGAMAFSSPGLIFYTISSFFLILACFWIIIGYINLYAKQEG